MIRNFVYEVKVYDDHYDVTYSRGHFSTLANARRYIALCMDQSKCNTDYATVWTAEEGERRRATQTFADNTYIYIFDIETHALDASLEADPCHFGI